MLYQIHRFYLPIMLLILAYMTYKGVDKSVFLSSFMALGAFGVILERFFEE